MSRLPARPLAGALISALISVLVIVSTSILGSAPASASTPPDVRALGVEYDTDLTLVVPKCEGCVITLQSIDGVNTPYVSLPATVANGSVTMTLPSARTAGLSVRVVPTWVTQPGPSTFVAWRYAGNSIGDTVGFKQARAKKRASGCWAGTVNEAVTLTVKVRRVTQGGRLTAIAWAPVTESFFAPMLRVRSGVLASDTGVTCKTTAR